MFYCFGCGAGGTVIRFLMDIEGLPFQDAITRLAERVNLPLPFSPADPVSKPSARFQRMKEAHELAAKWFNYILMNSAAGVQALSYLKDRGISGQTTVDFRLGYAPDSTRTLVTFLGKRGFDSDLLVDAGLAVRMGNQVVDRFRGRVMIPICDAQGAVVAFGGRVLAPDGKPKYLNSPETPLFKKGLLLFNQHAARREIRKAQTAVLLEGYMDVLSAWQAGAKNGVASLGTSLTEEQAILLKRSANRLLISYDGDSAGRKAAVRALDIAESAGLDVRILLLPEGLDPDEFVRKNGGDAFLQYLQTGAKSPVEFLVEEARAAANLGTPVGRNDFLRQVLQILAERATPIEQDEIVRKLALEFSVSVPALTEELALVTRRANKRRRQVQATREPKASPTRVVSGSVRAGERILQSLFTDLNLCEELMNRGVDELGTPEQTALLARYYSFRADHPNQAAGAFIDSLDDPQLRGYASSLLIDEGPEFDSNVLEDYLRTIRMQKLQTQLLECAKQSDEARRRGDESAAESLGAQIEAVKSAIAELKSRHGM